MSVTLRVAAGVLALVLQLVVLDAAIRTFLLPRVAQVRLSRFVARAVSMVFHALTRRARTYRLRDRVLSLYPSIVLLSYQTTWLALSAVAFALAFFSAGVRNFLAALRISGSSLFTLGTSPAHGGSQSVLQFVEAGVGLTLLALLIAFIPTLYSGFQRREVSVSRLSVRSGIPATPWGILEIAKSVESFELLDELWREWEQWFIELGETHTTLPILNYYRSPDRNQTWFSAAVSVLDAAALYNAAVDMAVSPTAGLCIRSGWLTLRQLAQYFRIPYPETFDGTESIRISREEFEQVLARLERGGVPILADHEVAWRDFVGWRVNYDAIVESGYQLFDCPRVTWRDADNLPLVKPSNRRGHSER